MGHFICAYSGSRCDDSQRSREHIIPDSAGGSSDFAINCVSKEANSNVGAKVDAPFLRNFVTANEILLRGIKSKSRGAARISFGRTKIHIAGDTYEAELILTDDGFTVSPIDVKRTHTAPVTGNVVVSYLTDDVADLKEKLEGRRKLQNLTVEGPFEQSRFHFQVEIKPNDFVREFCKIALATAVYAFGEEFLITPSATRLRQGMWASDAEIKELGMGGYGWPNQLDQNLTTTLSTEGCHVIALLHLNSKIGCFISLFGRFTNLIDITGNIESDGSKIGAGVVYMIDPTTKKLSTINYNDYLNKKVESALDALGTVRG